MIAQTTPSPLFAYDEAVRSKGYALLCGVDEAGRGPLAGPVFAAAVILPPDLCLPGLNDSKKLSAKRREALYDAITGSGAVYAVASVDERAIDAENILRATLRAMRMAVEALSVRPDLALIDGNQSPNLDGVFCRTVVGGDGVSAAIAAASILAKVSRDRYMLSLHEHCPAYGFDKHKGYGTRLHYEALREHGPSPHHRMSFLKNLPRSWEE